MSKLAHSNDETMAQIEANSHADDRDEFTGHKDVCRGGAADCTCSPDYRENLAQIAETLMEETARFCPGWHPADCPSEIVVDLINERDDTRKVLLMTASQHQGGHSATGGAIADLFGLPFPLTMETLEAKAIELNFDPKELWPWLAPMRAGKTT